MQQQQRSNKMSGESLFNVPSPAQLECVFNQIQTQGCLSDCLPSLLLALFLPLSRFRANILNAAATSCQSIGTWNVIKINFALPWHVKNAWTS